MGCSLWALALGELVKRERLRERLKGESLRWCLFWMHFSLFLQKKVFLSRSREEEQDCRWRCQECVKPQLKQAPFGICWRYPDSSCPWCWHVGGIESYWGLTAQLAKQPSVTSPAHFFSKWQYTLKIRAGKGTAHPNCPAHGCWCCAERVENVSICYSSILEPWRTYIICIKDYFVR